MLGEGQISFHKDSYKHTTSEDLKIYWHSLPENRIEGDCRGRP